MNDKKKIPLIAALIPLLLLFGAVCFVVMFVKWIFSGKKIVEKKPEAMSADAEAERRWKEAETAVFRPIPAEIPAAPPLRPALVIPSVSGGNSAQNRSIPANSGGNPNVPPSPPPAPKKIIMREDMANIFQRGARALTRTAAVAALKRLGFGKSAAYEALSANGRFSAWLKVASDGIITWKG